MDGQGSKLQQNSVGHLLIDFSLINELNIRT